MLNNRSRGFTWRTHKNVIEVIGQVGCEDDKPRVALQDYEKLLGQGSAVYATVVSPGGLVPDAVPIQDLRER